MLTALVPIDLVTRPNQITERAVVIAEALSAAGIKAVFSHNHRKGKADREFISVMSAAQMPGVYVKSEQLYGGVVNASLLRNAGIAHVTTEFVLLLDVDIWPDVELFKRRERVVQESDSFDMVPCLYLSSRGTRELIRSYSHEMLKEQYFSYRRGQFLHLAAPSSIITLAKSSYDAIGGFDESFEGHGFEDFDFMVRLAEYHGLLEKSRDFVLDKHARSPLFAEGFRRDLSRFCITAMLNKDIAFHLYHKKVDIQDYKSQRAENYRRFVAKHSVASDARSPEFDTLMPEFLDAVGKMGRSASDYSIYFDNKPGHIDRFDTFKKRLRFLMHG